MNQSTDIYLIGKPKKKDCMNKAIMAMFRILFYSLTYLLTSAYLNMLLPKNPAWWQILFLPVMIGILFLIAFYMIARYEPSKSDEIKRDFGMAFGICIGLSIVSLVFNLFFAI